LSRIKEFNIVETQQEVEVWVIENAETHKENATIFSSEEALIQTLVGELMRYIPLGTPLVEMGIGTPRAVKRKALPIMNALFTTDYVCVDASCAFLQNLKQSGVLRGYSVRPFFGNFFEDKDIYFDEENEDALICMLGSTIGNIVAPRNESLPEVPLTHHLRSVSRTARRGYMLVSYDSCRNSSFIKSYYIQHNDFHLNFLYRIAAELPVTGDFDPTAFTYEADWIESSGQLAHMAIVTRDMDFEIDNVKISLKKNQRLHIKNSFKFTPAFFNHCAEMAGLEHLKTWQDPAGTCIGLFHKKTVVAASTQRHSLVANG